MTPPRPTIVLDLRQHLPLAIQALINEEIGKRGGCQYSDPCIIGSMIPEEHRGTLFGAVEDIAQTPEGATPRGSERQAGRRLIMPNIEQIKDADALQTQFDLGPEFDGSWENELGFMSLFRILVLRYCPDELYLLDSYLADQSTLAPGPAPA